MKAGRPCNDSRREFLRQAGAAVAACTAACAFGGEAKRPKVAAVFTEFRLRSHAYNFLTNLLGPYLFRGRWVDSGVDVVSFYADQFPASDMARHVSRKYEIPLFPSIDRALCVGGKELAVDAVLVVGEHGDYPTNELGQTLYPRKEFFDQCVAVMRRSRRFVPLFNDKHLSYRWDLAKEMYDTSRELGIPLMAGSSVPLGERRPALDLPEKFKLAEAVAVHGGGMEVYGYHGLELLQSFVESRQGGETGISRVQLFAGDAYRKAADAGLWSRELAEAALTAERSAAFKRQPPAVIPRTVKPAMVIPDHAIVVTYKDGTKGTVLRIGSDSNRWNFACRMRGEDRVRATTIINGPWGNYNFFSTLTNAIAHFFKTGKPPYPVERTLLAGGAIDAAMHSHHTGKPIDTPQLEFAYTGVDFGSFRESGDSAPILKDLPQPTTFAPGPPAALKP